MGLFFRTTLLQTLVLTVLILLSLQVVTGQVRSSSNYQLQSDSINIGGGLSSSTNFVQESTVGEIATGDSASSNYQLRAGYQQMQEVFISMTAATDVVMSPELPGITGGTANGSSSVNVTTDSPAGYSLSLKASDSPAMQGVFGSIADYPHGANPHTTFTVGTGQAYFGYSVEGVDTASYFLDDGSGRCNSGGSINTPDMCWAGLDTAGRVIAQATDANQPAGSTSTVLFRVGLGGNNSVLSGVYTATTTLTALPL